jgi:hypothetical protein
VDKAARTTLRRGIAAACALAALIPASPAVAQRTPGAFFPGQVVDGPSSDVRALGGVDLARDGSGGLAYVRRDGGEDHVFVSPLVAGVPRTPVRVDAGQGPLIGLPAIAAGDRGRLAVVYANPAGVFAVVRAAGDQPFGAPQQIGQPGAAAPSVDLAATGSGYAVWEHAGDVRSAYLPRLLTAFAVHPTPLDADPAREAGSGAALRPAVAASADGLGIAVWGERDGAITRVFARRLVRGASSAVSADATLGTLDGRAARSADTPDIGVEDDSSYAWVVFRQAVDDGAGGTVVRAVARRLRGSGFDDPAAIDGAPASGAVSAPRVGVNGRGAGIAVVEGPGGATLASVIRDDVVSPAGVVGLTGGAAAWPASGFGENADGVAAWLAAPEPGLAPVVQARLLEDDPALPVAPAFGSAVTLSDPAGGPVDPDAGFDVGVSRAGDAVIAYTQGSEEAGRRIAVGVYDRGPGAPAGTTTTNWRRAKLPELVWAPSLDLWNSITYQVLVDGLPIGATQGTRLTASAPIPDGLHRWQVVATDVRGQTARSATRNLRIDATPPRLLLRVSGRRTAGRKLLFAVRALDLRSPAGSGIRRVRIDFRDRSRVLEKPLERPSFSHVFRAGTFFVRVSATDWAGNSSVLVRKVVVKKPKKKGKKKKPSRRPSAAPKAPASKPAPTTGGAPAAR